MGDKYHDRGELLVASRSNGVRIDPSLVGEKAFKHPSVLEWWNWLKTSYMPKHSLALITPCSRVKPYTKSPTSRKIRAMLRRLGLWSENEGKPVGLEWLYFSDLLALVPYSKAEEYPACCYDVPPDLVLSKPQLLKYIVEPTCTVITRFRRIITFLPRKHIVIWEKTIKPCKKHVVEIRVKYTIFSMKELEQTIVKEVAAQIAH